MGGGHGRKAYRHQRWLKADESRDATANRHGVGLTDREAFHSRSDGTFRFRVQAVKSPRPQRPRMCRARYDGLKQKLSLFAPRNAPLRTSHKPGAETALFLYHRYFPGAQRPDGERL